MTHPLLSSDEIDDVLERICCGGECRAYNGFTDGICSRWAYQSAAEKVIADSQSQADMLLGATLRTYGLTKPPR
jgi:hypothetical protein